MNNVSRKILQDVGEFGFALQGCGFGLASVFSDFLALGSRMFGMV